MNILSLCKNIDLKQFIDLDAFNSIANEISGNKDSHAGFQIIISDDANVINSFRSKLTREALLLIPIIALLKADSSYSLIYKCIASGAAALVIQV